MTATVPKLIKEMIESTVICAIGSALIAGLSCVIWVWAAIIVPDFDIWLAVQYTFWTLFGISWVYCFLDTWESYG